jgi:hypothetical protein
MNEFITKPISVKGLIAMVDRFLPQPEQALADSTAG